MQYIHTKYQRQHTADVSFWFQVTLNKVLKDKQRNLIKDGFQEELTLRAKLKAWMEYSVSLNIRTALHHTKKKREEGGGSTKKDQVKILKNQFIFCQGTY